MDFYFDFDESLLEEAERCSFDDFISPKPKPKPKEIPNKSFSIKELEDCFVESYIQDYFYYKNNNMVKKIIKEIYETAYDILGFFSQINKEVRQKRKINDKGWYSKYKS